MPSTARRPAGAGGFCRRYGFRDKPHRVRFRILDTASALLPGLPGQDITLNQTDFALLNPVVRTVYITENEVNFLAFPRIAKAMVIFGAGYGFENIAPAASTWMAKKEILYWGDIDTHGFAILNQLRKFFPQAKSLLMDSETLLEHRALWGREGNPENAELNRLTAEEQLVYSRLCSHYWGENVRLEQEKIGFDWVLGRI